MMKKYLDVSPETYVYVHMKYAIIHDIYIQIKDVIGVNVTTPAGRPQSIYVVEHGELTESEREHSFFVLKSFEL